jgi:hypothetical protein
MVCLALALTTSAVMAASLSELKLSRAELEHSRIENLLSGAQQRAWLAALGVGSAARYAWTLPTTGEPARALLESEGAKTGLAAAAALEDSDYAPLAISDVPAFKERLKALSVDQALGPALEALDASPVWRACARSLVSPFGNGKTLQLAAAQTPSRDAANLHTGEVWRVRVATADGWTDERFVRFTGDALHPAAVIRRRFSKQDGEGDRCEAILGAS